MNRLLSNDGDPDYRRGYLELKSVTWDRVTGLPAFPVLLDELRVALERRRQIGVVHVEAVNLELIESLYGWQMFDQTIGTAAATLKSALGTGLPPSTLLAQDRVSGDRLLAFVVEGPNGAEVDAAFLRRMGEELTARLATAFAAPEFAELSPDVVFRAGHALLVRDPFYRFERQVYAAVGRAARDVRRREARRERSWGEELQKIMREAAIRSVLQPVVALDSREVLGHEAFARGPRDSLFETPRTMFALSGRLGVEDELDALCLESALRASVEAEDCRKLFVNVLTAATDVDQAGDRVRALARTHGLEPATVVLEVKERAADKRPEAFFATVERFRELGFGIALDDLGTGFATREVVERMRPDFVKLDESIVRGVHANLLKQELVGSLVRLADHAGAAVIAECVENEHEAATLGRAGAAYAQGYWFAAPAPPPQQAPSGRGRGGR